MPIRFLRFASRSATPGPPIVYLAGGPGGSGIGAAAGSRWPIFDALRDVADVIALDQRGTGAAYDLPTCTTGEPVSRTMPTTRENLSRVFAAQVRHCREFWESVGVDLAAYNTVESADDIEDLRRALGASTLDLWGISYGTHLALATLKRHPGSIRRVVLISAEGLDQTAKSPAAGDAFFARVQASIDADSAARLVYPDVVAMIRRVVARASATPVTVAVETADGRADIVLGDFELQRLAADRLADPQGTAVVLAAFARADSGDYSVFGRWAQRVTGEPIFIDPMPLAMDGASGASASRRASIEREAGTSVLGDALAWPVLHVDSALADLDLGDAFRLPFHSRHPVLLISGTLDGRTYLEEHREIGRQFDAPIFVTAVNGGHNTALASAQVQQLIKRFLAGEAVSDTVVTLPAPAWLGGR